jgi:elongation factor 1-gamma
VQQGSGHVLPTAPFFHFGQTNRSSDFLLKLPLHEVAAFKSEDEFTVIESNAVPFS